MSSMYPHVSVSLYMHVSSSSHAQLCKGDQHYVLTRWGRVRESGNACDARASFVTRISSLGFWVED
jgi:hypothetical protein